MCGRARWEWEEPRVLLLETRGKSDRVGGLWLRGGAWCQPWDILLPAGRGPSGLPCPAASPATFLCLAGPAERGRSSGNNRGQQLRLSCGVGIVQAGMSSCPAFWVSMTKPVMYVNVCNACRCTHLLEPRFPASQRLPPRPLPHPSVAMAPKPQGGPGSMCPRSQAVRVGTLGTDGDEAAPGRDGAWPQGTQPWA